jgi:phosphohistidine phosphatase
VQTAEIVAEAFGIEVSDTTTSLTPEARLEEFEKWCAGVGPRKVVAVVGHEPHLSTLVTWLLSGERDSRVRLRKGGAALLEFEADVRREAGTLGWLVTPRLLAASAENG